MAGWWGGGGVLIIRHVSRPGDPDEGGGAVLGGARAGAGSSSAAGAGEGLAGGVAAGLASGCRGFTPDALPWWW